MMARFARESGVVATNLPADSRELMVNHVRQRRRNALKQLLVRPWEWPAMAVYGYVRIMERIMARRQIAAGETGWGRDETGRQSN